MQQHPPRDDMVPAQPAKTDLPGTMRIPPDVTEFLKEGEQTRITPAVRDFAERFPGKDMTVVTDILSTILNFRRVEYDDNGLRDIYSKRTADETIRRGEIAFGTAMVKGSKVVVDGCIDYSAATCAVLRAKGIPAKFIRIADHALVHFYIEGKWHEASVINVRRGSDRRRQHDDPQSSTRITSLREVDETRRRLYEHAKEQGEYGEGLDAWDPRIGILSINDFKKFMRQVKAKEI
jgi:hypothetical protein